MGKKNVHKLSNDPEQNLILFGISSHENDYRLSWSINEHIGFHLTRTENLKLVHPKLKEEQEFSTYSYEQEDFYYRLVSNRCSNGFLLEELKNIDYLLLVEEKSDAFPMQDFLIQIKSVPFISAVFRIQTDTLKSINRLK